VDTLEITDVRYIPILGESWKLGYLLRV
jgi:hypothetical protein